MKKLMRTAGMLAVAVLLAFTATMACAQSAEPATSAPAEDWRETYAYTLGTQAFVFGFPSYSRAFSRPASWSAD